MKLILSLALLFTVSLAFAATAPEKNSSENKAAEVKEAEYGGHCPMGLCLKKRVKGDEKFSLDYKGKHYIFSSEESRANFKKDMDKNIETANSQWSGMGASEKANK